jgi:ATP-binding cassette subfamily F protein uup
VPRENAPAKPKKLSYREQRELEELPNLIARLEEEQKAISERLADPDLYQREPEEARRLGERFAQIDTELMESLERWEEIEARGR